jgi:hypothetical protein
MLVHFLAIWSILRPFRKCYGLLVYFVVILVHFSRFGVLFKEKSGNPGKDTVQKMVAKSWPRERDISVLGFSCVALLILAAKKKYCK